MGEIKEGTIFNIVESESPKYIHEYEVGKKIGKNEFGVVKIKTGGSKKGSILTFRIVDLTKCKHCGK